MLPSARSPKGNGAPMVLQGLASVLYGWFMWLRPTPAELTFVSMPDHARLCDAIAACRKEPAYASCTMGVVLRNQPGVVYAYSQGDMNPNSLARIYSMTKPITSLALLRLVQDGWVSLDDPVSKHLPEFAAPLTVSEGGQGELRPAARDLTLKHLLTHTSGLGYGDIPPRGPDQAVYEDLCRRTDNGEFRNLAEWVRELARLPLLADPGTEWRYSFSTDVAGRVVEEVSAKAMWPWGRPDLYACLWRSVLGPLGMHDTTFAVEASKLRRLVPLYRARYDRVTEDGATRKTFRSLEQIDAADAHSMWAAPHHSPVQAGGGGAESVQGGLVSSLADYTRLCFALLHHGRAPASGRWVLDPSLCAEACLRDHLRELGVAQEDWGWSLVGSVDPKAASRGEAERGAERGGGFGWGGLGGTMFHVDDEHGWALVFFAQVRGVDAGACRPLHALLKRAVREAAADGAFESPNPEP